MIDPLPIVRLIRQRGDRVLLVLNQVNTERNIQYGAPVVTQYKTERELLAYVVPDSMVAAAAISQGQLKGGTHLCYVMANSLKVEELTPDHRIVYRGISYQIIVLEPIIWKGRAILIQLRLNLTQESKQVSQTIGIQPPNSTVE